MGFSEEQEKCENIKPLVDLVFLFLFLTLIIAIYAGAFYVE